MINKFTGVNRVFITIAVLLIGTAILHTGCAHNQPARQRHVLTEERRAELSTQDMIQILKEGNQAFVNGDWIDWDYQHEQIKTAAGQYPGGIILSCMDS